MATATATRKAAKSTKQRKHTPALELVIPYQEKIRLMVLEVVREEAGRELSAAARFNSQDFDWEEFNAQFRKDYGATSLKELIRYARIKFGLNSLDEIRERRVQHKQRRRERIANAGGFADLSDEDAGYSLEMEDLEGDEIDLE